MHRCERQNQWDLSVILVFPSSQHHHNSKAFHPPSLNKKSIYVLVIVNLEVSSDPHKTKGSLSKVMIAYLDKVQLPIITLTKIESQKDIHITSLHNKAGREASSFNF